jgi:uncharacterized protein
MGKKLKLQNILILYHPYYLTFASYVSRLTPHASRLTFFTIWRKILIYVKINIVCYFGELKMEKLIIDISDISGFIGLSKKVNLKIKMLPLETVEGEKDFVGPVEIDFIIENVRSGILVKGKLKGGLLVNCDRCLKEFEQILDIDIEEMHYFEKDLFENKEVNENEAFKVINNKINLEPIIRQNFVLNIPIKLICKEECRGLCFMCGKDLNEGSCDCKKDDIDPRFAKLKKLLEEN